MAPKESSDPEYVALQKEIESLKTRISASQKAVRDAELDQVALSVPELSKLKLQTKRNLKGHIHKVNGVAFSGDSRIEQQLPHLRSHVLVVGFPGNKSFARAALYLYHRNQSIHLVSGSLDGKLIIWDTWTGNKVQIIPLRSSWVMTVAFAESGNYVASGGMDNLCTVHDLNNRNATGEAKVLRELVGYDGFLTCVKFLNDRELVTGSGDMKISKWDIETGKRALELYGHAGDVVSVSVHPSDENLLITGSVDQTAKLWDLRMPAAQQTFYGHTADVNAVFYHPSTFAFATASEDFTARLFDIRADQQVSLNKASAPDIGFTSTVLSKSGRYLVAGGDDGGAHVWDVLKSVYLGNLSGHEDRITSLSITESGLAIASASWDQSVRVWL